MNLAPLTLSLLSKGVLGWVVSRGATRGQSGVYATFLDTLATDIDCNIAVCQASLILRFLANARSFGFTVASGTVMKSVS